MSVVAQGYLSPQLVITQGYLSALPTLVVHPESAYITPLGSVTMVASVASSWSASGGSLVVAGDNLSATFTDTGASVSYTVTVTDLSDPGNVRLVEIYTTTQEEFGDHSGQAGRRMVGDS